MKKEKLSLEELKIDSFVTSDQKKVKGGTIPVLITGGLIAITVSIAICN